MDLKSIADQLYALPPADFMAARTEFARQAQEAGDKQTAARIGKLRKPSQAAWVLNLFARKRPEELRQLANLGSALRDAHGRVDGETLRELTRQRHKLIRAMVGQAQSLAVAEGHKPGDPRELESVFAAALADPAVAETLQSGTLWATNQFGRQEAWPEAQAPSVDEVAVRREQRAERQRQELGRARAEAQHTADVRDRAQNALGHAEQKAERAAKQIAELTAELERARQAEIEANNEVKEARTVFRTAEKAAERARRHADQLGNT